MGARIELVSADGTATVLKEKLALQEGEIIDATFLSRKALLSFLDEQVKVAKEQGILFSLHMKATMMKVSDPIIFGHCVRVYFKNLVEKHSDLLKKLGVNFNNGLGDLTQQLAGDSDALSADERKALQQALDEAYQNGPGIAMVDSDRGITNLHVPSDVIIDASMPAMIRTSGQMWNKEGNKILSLSFLIPRMLVCTKPPSTSAVKTVPSILPPWVLSLMLV